MHILLLEDDAQLNEIMQVAIRAARRGINLQSFVNSDRAHAYVLEHHQDIHMYILDIRVPGEFDGYELGERIRALDPRAPIILTSAYQRPASKDRIQELNFEWHPKPWHVFDVQKRVVNFKIEAQPRPRRTTPPAPMQDKATPDAKTAPPRRPDVTRPSSPPTPPRRPDVTRPSSPPTPHKPTEMPDDPDRE